MEYRGIHKMVRYNGVVMSEVRYQEIKKAEADAKRKLSLQQRLNLFFFDEEEICLSDWLWFYGGILFSVFITLAVCIPAWIQLLTL
jgi:hypothetical protein